MVTGKSIEKLTRPFKYGPVRVTLVEMHEGDGRNAENILAPCYPSYLLI